MTITTIGPDQSGAFAAIWIPWLRDVIGATPEAEDPAVMADPMAYYTRTGGTAFLATDDEQVIGAVAVKGLDASGFEFCKLVVTDAARGRGAGRALVEACIAYATLQGGPMLYLQSFRALDVALALYRKMGFIDIAPPAEMAILKRTQVIMAKTLADAVETVMRDSADGGRLP